MPTARPRSAVPHWPGPGRVRRSGFTLPPVQSFGLPAPNRRSFPKHQRYLAPLVRLSRRRKSAAITPHLLCAQKATGKWLFGAGAPNRWRRHGQPLVASLPRRVKGQVERPCPAALDPPWFLPLARLRATIPQSVTLPRNRPLLLQCRLLPRLVPRGSPSPGRMLPAGTRPKWAGSGAQFVSSRPGSKPSAREPLRRV